MSVVAACVIVGCGRVLGCRKWVTDWNYRLLVKEWLTYWEVVHGTINVGCGCSHTGTGKGFMEPLMSVVAASLNVGFLQFWRETQTLLSMASIAEDRVDALDARMQRLRELGNLKLDELNQV